MVAGASNLEFKSETWFKSSHATINLFILDIYINQFIAIPTIARLVNSVFASGRNDLILLLDYDHQSRQWQIQPHQDGSGFGGRQNPLSHMACIF